MTTEVQELDYYHPKLLYLEKALISRILEAQLWQQMEGTILKAVGDLIKHLPGTNGQCLVVSAQKPDTWSRKQRVVLAMSLSPLYIKRHWNNFFSYWDLGSVRFHSILCHRGGGHVSWLALILPNQNVYGEYHVKHGCKDISLKSLRKFEVTVIQ